MSCKKSPIRRIGDSLIKQASELQAAVDGEALARNEFRLLRAEEHRCIGNIVGITKTL